jgi:predicted ATPase
MLKNIRKNNWIVLTGAPSSGKTTVLKELEKKGFRVVYEVARTYIDKQIKLGKTIKEIRKNELFFQKKILDLKMKLEKSLPKNEIIFFERAIPDTVAYYKLCGITSDNKLKKILNKCSYSKVFILHLINYKKDYARVETASEAKKLEKLLKESYQKIKSPIINVPAMPVKKIVKFIINHL